MEVFIATPSGDNVVVDDGIGGVDVNIDDKGGNNDGRPKGMENTGGFGRSYMDTSIDGSMSSDLITSRGDGDDLVILSAREADDKLGSCICCDRTDLGPRLAKEEISSVFILRPSNGAILLG